MTINFTAATEYKGKQSRNVKRIQIHVVEAQGLLSAKGSARIPSAYVTVESPGLGTLHQTSSVGKGKRLVWHENTRIVELRPTAPIKFTVKRHALLPIGNQVLGSTATYDLSQLIEMQGKNDRETCVTLSLNSGTESPKSKSSPSLVINIRDLDTREKIEQVRESAVYAASIRSRSRDSASMSGESSPVSSRSLDFPTTPPLTADSSTFSYSLSAPTSPTLQSASLAYSPLPPRPTTTEAVAASVMSVAVASPASSQRKRSQTVPSLHEIIEEPRHY